jgi:predicted nucleotidyltransferase
MTPILSDHPVSDAMRATILDCLRGVEAEHGVHILYACESGSRGWGFASPDSDYDVRFVYVHRLDWYLTVDPGRDVIEKPISGELDVSGWDLRKALKLLHGSNPVLHEWLRSPIVYRQDETWAPRLRALADARRRSADQPALARHPGVHRSRARGRAGLHAAAFAAAADDRAG